MFKGAGLVLNNQLPYINIHAHTANETSDVITIQSCHLHTFESRLPASYFSLGLHPWFANQLEKKEIAQKISLLQNNANYLAVGEIGLDKIRLECPMAIQYEVFEQQLILANEIQKPVIIHNVRSTAEILHAVKINCISVPVIFHGFMGKYQTATQILNSGAYLSFGKALLNHQYTIEALRQIPLDRVFFETDDSDCLIQDIYHCVSDLKKMSVTNVKEICYNNFRNVFTIKNAKLA